MLVATRDPLLQSGAPDASRATRAAAPRFAGLMTGLQIAGSLLALPVGLVSGYSVYHANFSAEARCQNLRANIISTLDKSADASTLRMLVRRDVTAFEVSCATVDPDAVAAFRSLFAARPQPAKMPLAAPPAPAGREMQATRATAQPPAAKVKPAAAESVPDQHAATASDAAWLAAVRHALVHSPDEKPLPAASAADGKPPIHIPSRPASNELNENPNPVVAPVATVPGPPSTAPAPTAPADADHPVPPALVVGPSQPANVAANAVERSRSVNWYARIPLIGRAFGGGGEPH
jgi:hypothetical protein